MTMNRRERRRRDAILNKVTSVQTASMEAALKDPTLPPEKHALARLVKTGANSLVQQWLNDEALSGTEAGVLIMAVVDYAATILSGIAALGIKPGEDSIAADHCASLLHILMANGRIEEARRNRRRYMSDDFLADSPSSDLIQ